MGVDMLRLDSQEDGPTIPVVKLFPSGEFPEDFKTMDLDLCIVAICGEQYPKRREIWSVWRKPIYNSVRQAAEVHSEVRKYVRSIVKPGMLMTDVCETLEDIVSKLISENGLKAGIAFPTGCSLNWVAAHWTPNSGDKTVLQYDDVMKVDFATHIDGMTANFSFISPLYKSQIETNISWIFAGDISLYKWLSVHPKLMEEPLDVAE
ncbi:hypothetical protein Bca52824_066732 [Brassica carinata]|uniref:Peptidase M24 domain-containing protein n=1 Tax=Brassica carinata TaxID=52824 RepID=A0A8X7UAY5_BRACI|nr:hypothetical protein Bca52824_066732 [Brassica carinata]